MKIGLTGSIACGKSTVSQYLRQKGCFIVDADAISRALTADGGAALPEIRRAFGDDVFSGASLDRAKLGQLVFADAQKRETLNAILHPMILSEIRRQLDRLDAPGQIVVGDVPLLFECGMESMFDTVWVVRAARETQIQRLFERDGLSRRMKRSAAQTPSLTPTVPSSRRTDRWMRCWKPPFPARRFGADGRRSPLVFPTTLCRKGRPSRGAPSAP